MAKKNKTSRFFPFHIVLFALFIMFVVSATIYIYKQKTKLKTSNTIAVKASQLAYVLLDEKQIEDVLQMPGKIYPGSVQFNDHLDPFDIDKEITYVARGSTLRTNVNDNVFENAVLLFSNNNDAMAYLNRHAKDAGVPVTYSFEGTIPTETDTSVNKDGTAALALRFVIGNVGAKVEIDGNAKTVLEAEALFLSMAKSAATLQKQKVEAYLNGTLKIDIQNDAETLLPTHIANTTFLGKTIESNDEYISNTGENSIIGFTEGAHETFKMNDRPAEVVDVSVIKFNTPSNAKAYLDTFGNNNPPNGPAFTNFKTISLPDSLTKYKGKASSQSGIVEFQAVKGTHFYDIIIEAPFESVDIVKASKDIIPISEEVMNQVL